MRIFLIGILFCSFAMADNNDEPIKIIREGFSDPEALYQLAEQFKTVNPKDALFFYQQAAEGGHTEAKYKLAELLLEYAPLNLSPAMIEAMALPDCHNDTIIEVRIITGGKITTTYWYEQAVINEENPLLINSEEMLETGDDVSLSPEKAIFRYECPHPFIINEIQTSHDDTAVHTSPM